MKDNKPKILERLKVAHKALRTARRMLYGISVWDPREREIADLAADVSALEDQVHTTLHYYRGKSK